MASKVIQSLETPPVKLSTSDPFEGFLAFSPLTPNSMSGDAVFVVFDEHPEGQTSSPSMQTINKTLTDNTETELLINVLASPHKSADDTTVLDTSPSITAAPSSTESNNIKVKKRRVRHKDSSIDAKQMTRALQYPPCCVCGGRASGDHYGINTCEACKGFFRRYLLREKGAYQCKKSGQCEVLHTLKRICAGCRLNKCLHLGMAKEKCKLGRYSSEKRTEKIKTALELKASPVKTVNKLNNDINPQEYNFDSLNSPSQDSACQDEILIRSLSQLNISAERRDTFCDDMVTNLVKAKHEMKPFDTEKCLTDEEIKVRIKEYSDDYILKVKMYGEMKPVAKEEFTKLYGDFGIDVDDRIKELKQASDSIEHDVNAYCCFAKHIPYFSKLSFKDQSNLLKACRIDFYSVLMSRGYDPLLQVILHRFRPYHVNEMDKFFSKDLVLETLHRYERCQNLRLNDREQSILMALSIFSTDRCRLENASLVEMIQLSLAQLFRQELEKTCPETALSRFTKAIDYLIDLREVGEAYIKEYEDLCRDDHYLNVCPVLTDFLLET